MSIVEMWTQLGSAIAGLMFVWAMYDRYFPYQLRGYVERYSHKLVALVFPYFQIIFDEYTGEDMMRSEVYAAIQSYLSANSSMRAKRLKADVVKDSQSVLLTMDDHEEITDDFNGIKGKNYYDKIGKPWKRGYLLYGPPGTGKSTMIAAMANFLNYDIYDLELTTVKDNSELRKLLIETKSKSIYHPCGGERIIVFTTNYVEKLDPALIRRGRMDKHIEMSYCCFEAFKVLAQNYLDIESHELFGKIQNLLEETKMTPADVAENLMPKSEEEDEETCLKKLIAALEEAKEEEARKKSEEEAAKLKAEQEEEKAPKEDGKEKDNGKIKENGFNSNGNCKSTVPSGDN
ncbi:hypothetical protein GH714_012006 [Hevea brasiliensis]|uniref:AAA+ ATPase domain-containing protein n=1 Tax=Hevea brasiliensis TaxID=3981 RepID=A0A6A6M817_HEVBR|nr:hypothetical protein GH714_012006 [Hevea brasiliensis]